MNKNTKTKTNVKMIAAPVAPPALVAAPVPAPVAAPVPAPVAAGEVIGEANLTSKRITAGTALTQFRVVSNQRKNVTARYYVQGGTYRTDPVSKREMFAVSVEIPHIDLHAAKTQLVALQAELAARQKSA